MMRTSRALYVEALDVLLKGRMAEVAVAHDWDLLEEVARLATQDASTSRGLPTFTEITDAMSRATVVFSAVKPDRESSGQTDLLADARQLPHGIVSMHEPHRRDRLAFKRSGLEARRGRRDVARGFALIVLECAFEGVALACGQGQQAEGALGRAASGRRVEYRDVTASSFKGLAKG